MTTFRQNYITRNFVLLQTPGPGTYTVVHPNVYKQKSPFYSITGRNPLPTDSTLKPGPGAHSPEKVGKDLYYNLFFIILQSKFQLAMIGFLCYASLGKHLVYF